MNLRFKAQNLRTLLILAVSAAAVHGESRPAAAEEQESLQGVWVAIGLWVGEREIPTIGKGERTPTATIRNDAMRVQVDDLTLHYQFKATPENTQPGAKRWWGRLDGTMNGSIPMEGWYLYQPAETNRGTEVLGIHLGPDISDQPIDRFANKRNHIKLVLVRSSRGRIIDQITRASVEDELHRRLGASLQRLQGKWRLLSEDNVEPKEEIVHEFAEDRYIRRLKYTDGSGELALAADVRVDDQQQPIQIDFDYGSSGMMKGVLRFEKRLEEELVIICRAGAGANRPTDFRIDAAKRHHLLVYQKVRSGEKRMRRRRAMFIRSAPRSTRPLREDRHSSAHRRMRFFANCCRTTPQAQRPSITASPRTWS